MSPSGSLPQRTFAFNTTTSPTVTFRRPNSLNSRALPSRTMITFTQSYATGPTGPCNVRVLARTGWDTFAEPRLGGALWISSRAGVLGPILATHAPQYFRGT